MELCSMFWFRNGVTAKPLNVEKLRRGQARHVADYRAPAEPLSQQPRREFTPTDPTARTADAKIQIISAGARIPFRPCLHPWPLPSATASYEGQRISRGARKGFQNLDAGDLRKRGSVIWNHLVGCFRPSDHHSSVNVTMPAVAFVAHGRQVHSQAFTPARTEDKLT